MWIIWLECLKSIISILRQRQHLTTPTALNLIRLREMCEQSIFFFLSLRWCFWSVGRMRKPFLHLWGFLSAWLQQVLAIWLKCLDFKSLYLCIVILIKILHLIIGIYSLFYINYTLHSTHSGVRSFMTLYLYFKISWFTSYRY